MPSLQVRDLPEHIYRSLSRKARAEHRSVAQQAVELLARGLDLELEPRARRRAILEALRADHEGGGMELPHPARLIREDRER